MRLSGRCGILIKIYSSLASQTEDNNMANNNGSNNNNSGGKNGKGNFRGVLTLIAWALVLTVVLVILPELAVMAKKAVSQKAKKETGKKQNTQMMI